MHQLISPKQWNSSKLINVISLANGRAIDSQATVEQSDLVRVFSCQIGPKGLVHELVHIARFVHLFSFIPKNDVKM